jgi:hypothetical protein
VTIHFTPRYYPRANPTERVNRVIKTTDIRLEDEIARRKLGFKKLYRDISEKLQIATERNRQVYEQRQRPVEYQPGQQVAEGQEFVRQKCALHDQIRSEIRWSIYCQSKSRILHI